MKKFLSIFIAFIITFIPFCFTASAKEPDSDVQTEYFEDGSYMTVGTSSVIENESSDVFAKILEFFRKLIEFFTGNKTISRTKYARYYDKNGNLLWTVFLEAEFSYNGKTSLCKNAKAYYETYDNDWEIISSESSADGNTATADFSVQQTKLGVKLKTVNKTLTLTCDKDGSIT